MDSDRIRSPDPRLGAGSHLYEAECLSKSDRAGGSCRDWAGRTPAPTPVPAGSSGAIAAVAQRSWPTLRPGGPDRRFPEDAATHRGSSLFRRSGVLRHQRIVDPACVAPAA